jgi:hypothetical protein
MFYKCFRMFQNNTIRIKIIVFLNIEDYVELDEDSYARG